MSGAWKSHPCAAASNSIAITASALSAIGHQPSRAVGGHGNVVFLIRRGRNGIDARRMRTLLVFRHERRCGDLRQHESRVEPRARREKRRQARQCGIDEHGDAAFGERSDLTQRQRDDIGGKRDRLGVEVATGQHGIVFRKDQRIVGNAVRFDLERASRMTEQIERCTHDLRLATQAVRILHASIIDAM